MARTGWRGNRSPSPCGELEVPYLRRNAPPIVVGAVHIFDRRGGEVSLGAVERGEADRIEGAAHLRDVAMTEGGCAAGAAEAVMHAVGVELIVAQRRFAAQQAELLGPDG